MRLWWNEILSVRVLYSQEQLWYLKLGRKGLEREIKDELYLKRNCDDPVVTSMALNLPQNLRALCCDYSTEDCPSPRRIPLAPLGLLVTWPVKQSTWNHSLNLLHIQNWAFFESSEKWNKNLDSSAFKIRGNCKYYASSLVSGFSNSSELFDQPNILRCMMHQFAFYLREMCQHIPDKWNLKKVRQCGVYLSLWRYSSHSLPWTCLTKAFKVLTSYCSPFPVSTMSSV